MSIIHSGITSHAPTQADVIAWMGSYLKEKLHLAPQAVTPSSSLDDLALDSAMVTALSMDMETWLGVSVPLATFFEASNLGDIAARVAAIAEANR